MPARAFVLVHSNGDAERISEAETNQAAQWLLRVYRGDVQKAFFRDGYACTHMSDDEQFGTLVWIERPVYLYQQERADRVRRVETLARLVFEMPEEGRHAAEGGP